MQSAQQVLTNYFQALGSKQIDKVIELVHDEAKFIILKKSLLINFLYTAHFMEKKVLEII